jgi:hypothetical protein
VRTSGSPARADPLMGYFAIVAEIIRHFFAFSRNRMV